MSSTTSCHTLVGRLTAVDPVSRVVRVAAGGSAVDVLVPPGVEIVLNRDHVRLRMLLAGDRVAIGLDPTHSRALARWIRVNPPADFVPT